MKTALTIAGSDSSGGAGIQADIKTMTAHKVYAMSVITAITAQNTIGVTGIHNVTKEYVEKQMDAVFTDIIPDAVKIGMVSSSEIIESIANKLREYKVNNLVIDPVMVATSGAKLIEDDAMEALKKYLFPLASILTPNIPETEVLANMIIESRQDMIEASHKISTQFKCAILCKGGHAFADANDLLYADGEITWFPGKMIDNPNTHGTGCTLSSAITSNLALGYDMTTSVKKAKEYITGAIQANLNLGKGRGPLNHMWNLERKDI